MSPRGALPTYIKEGEEEAGHQGRAKERGVLVGFGPPFFLLPEGGKGKYRE